MTSKLRPPNFHLSTNKSGSISYATNNNNSRHDDGDGIHLVSLSSYTNQCQKQMTLAASKNFDDSTNNNNNNNSDNENSTLDNEEVIYIGDNSNNHSSSSNNSGSSNRNSNNIDINL